MTDESIWESILPQLRQIGGKHYKNYKIQPYEFISKYNLSFYQGVVIKYVVRYLEKGGIEDLKKIVHYCQLEMKKINDMRKKK